METAAQQNSSDVRTAASLAVTPDPVTAELLKRHSANEKLTPQEYGKLGSFAKRVKGFFVGKDSAGNGSNQPGNEAGNTARLAPVSSQQTEGDRLVVPEADPGLVRRVTAAVLKSADKIARRWVEREARKAGADNSALARFDRAAALPEDNKELMIDVSPDVMASMGIDPKNYPATVFLGGLSMWGMNLWLCIDDLKAIQKERAEKEAKEKPAQPQPAVAPVSALAAASKEPEKSPTVDTSKFN